MLQTPPHSLRGSSRAKSTTVKKTPARLPTSPTTDRSLGEEGSRALNMAIVRTSPRAIIRRGNKYLVVHYQDASGNWSAFSGGGQLNGEDLHQALRREIYEEIGVVPKVGVLRFVRECIAARDNNGSLPADFHQLELSLNARWMPSP